MGNQQLDVFTADSGPIFAPVELERLARLEHQGQKSPSTSCLHCMLSVCLPCPNKGSHAFVRSIKTKLHQICMQLLGRAPLLARLSLLGQQPARQFLRKRLQLLGRAGVRKLDSMMSARRHFLMVLRDSPVRREISRMGYLAPQCSSSNYAQKSHVYHSKKTPD